MKAFIKKILKKLPYAFTINQQYDRQTAQVIKRVCGSGSNCIDVGCHKGEILDIMLKVAPQGKHFAFEPIPVLFDKLQEKYVGKNCSLYQIALSNTKSFLPFNYVVSNPAYSGLIRRKYDRPNEKDTSIEVATDRLDNIIPRGIKIDLIKIDVEGGEMQVLEGGIDTIRNSKPVIIFEHGLGASEFYGSSPEKIYRLLYDCGLKLSLMKDWLRGRPAFTENEFAEQFYGRKNFVFIAYPAV